MLVVSSFVPGRMRIRHPSLQTTWAAAAVTILRQLAGIVAVEHNRRVGSVLIEYDPQRLSKDELEANLQRLAAGTPSVGSPTPACAQNQALMTSLALTLGLTVAGAALGWRQLHVAAGVAFLGAVGVHVFGSAGKPPHPTP